MGNLMQSIRGRLFNHCCLKQRVQDKLLFVGYHAALRLGYNIAVKYEQDGVMASDSYS